jgi:hypothetical protein
MNSQDANDYIAFLDETMLKGGVTLSEWCIVIIQEADLAFVGGANLATVLTAMAGIETYLRSEYGSNHREGLAELTKLSPISDELKVEIDSLRIYRNRWVHVRDPNDDQELQKQPEKFDNELALNAKRAITALRKTIYLEQWA